MSAGSVIADRDRQSPGTVSVVDGSLYIATGNGAIEVTDLQLAGKKRMAAADFLRGFRDPERYRAV